MTNTVELLDAAKVAAGCGTDYQFAKRFQINLATVSGWRTGKRTLDDDHAAMIAGILGREPVEVMALCQAERAKDAVNRGRWLRAAALLAAAVLPPAAGASVDNNGALARVLPVQITDYARLRRAVLSALFGRSAGMTAA